MSIIKDAILLLKAEKSEGSNNKYSTLLSNHQSKQVRTLEFVYSNLDDLKEKLLSPDEFSGLILSSPRCVNAVQQSLPKDKIENLWKSKYNFTVGETTHKDAIDKLGLICEGKESGNAQNLSQIILQQKDKYNKPFLFPHGNLKADTLKLELGKGDIDVVGVQVYETLPSTTLETDLSDATDGFKQIPEFVIFFSPSGVRSCIDFIRRVPVDLGLIKFIAIGPVTEQAMKDLNIPIYGVAKNPNPEDVLQIIKQ